jgi:hypothetical protein
MGAKRAQENRSPPSKKSKVEQTIEGAAVQKLLDAFDGEIGNHLPARIVSVVKAVASDCLTNPASDRVPIESKFAEAIGASLQEAMQGLDAKVTQTAAKFEEQLEVVKKLEAELEEANAVKERHDAEVLATSEAEMNAQSCLMEAQTALQEQEAEEAALAPRKADLEFQQQGLQEVMDIARGPETNKKSTEKIQKALRALDAPDVLVLGVGAAIGKESTLEQQFVLETCKLFHAKRVEVDAELAAFDETAKSMAEKTKAMVQSVETLSASLEEREGEHTAAKEKQKAAGLAIKEATKAQNAGKKAADKFESAKQEAATFHAEGVETQETFQFLFTRTLPAFPADEEVPDVAPVQEETQEPAMEAEQIAA